LQRRAVEQQFALIRAVYAGQNLDERRFARAVVAGERQHFARQ
jgi:hypothetical protein